MRSHVFAPISAILFGLLLAACAAGQVASPSASEQAVSDPPTPDETPAATAPTAGIDEDAIAALVAMAAEEAQASIDEVRVVSAEEVTWSDGSLGCPQPGMAYTQALVPGFRVVVEIDGEELHFHAAQGGEFRICDDPQPPVQGADR